MKKFVLDQFQKLIELGFHEAAGFSESEFEKYIPIPKRENGLLVVSERCLNIAKQCECLGIRNEIFLDHHRNTVEIPPTFLYWRYDVDDGRTTKGLPNHISLEQFKEKKRFPAVTVEVLAIYRENPNVIKVSHFIDALGSEVSKDGDLTNTPALWMNGILVATKQKFPILGVYHKIEVDVDKEKGYERWGAPSVGAE